MPFSIVCSKCLLVQGYRVDLPSYSCVCPKRFLKCVCFVLTLLWLPRLHTCLQNHWRKSHYFHCLHCEHENPTVPQVHFKMLQIVECPLNLKGARSYEEAGEKVGKGGCLSTLCHSFDLDLAVSIPSD